MRSKNKIKKISKFDKNKLASNLPEYSDFSQKVDELLFNFNLKSGLTTPLNLSASGDAGKHLLDLKMLELKREQLKAYKKNFIAKRSQLEQEKERAEKIRVRLVTILERGKAYPGEYEAMENFLSNNKKKIPQHNQRLQNNVEINSPNAPLTIHEKLRNIKNSLTKTEKSLRCKQAPTVNKLMRYLSSVDPAMDLLDEAFKLFFLTHNFLNSLEEKIDLLPKNEKRALRSLDTLLSKAEIQANVINFRISEILKTTENLQPNNDSSPQDNDTLFSQLLDDYHPTYTYLLNHKNDTLLKFEQMLHDFQVVISNNENLSPHDRISHAYGFVKLFDQITQNVASIPIELDEQTPKIPPAYLSDKIKQQIQICYTLAPELKEKFEILHKQAYEIFAGKPFDGIPGASQLCEIHSWLSIEKNRPVQWIEETIHWGQGETLHNKPLLPNGTDILQRALNILDYQYKKYATCITCLQDDLGHLEPYSLPENKQLLQSCIELAHELSERIYHYHQQINKILSKKIVDNLLVTRCSTRK